MKELRGEERERAEAAAIDFFGDDGWDDDEEESAPVDYIQAMERMGYTWVDGEWRNLEQEQDELRHEEQRLLKEWYEGMPTRTPFRALGEPRGAPGGPGLPPSAERIMADLALLQQWNESQPIRYEGGDDGGAL